MLRKLEHDALAADLAAVEAILASNPEDDDPVGHFQFSLKKDDIREKLRRLESRIDKHAELGVFFGGGPVQGSRGINADFAGKALDELQALIAKRYSDQHGVLNQKGRLPLANHSKMLVTNIVRGSVGFVLEESGETAPLVDTPLHTIVDEVADILSCVGAADEGLFDEAAAALDQRILGSLRDFFLLLDEQQATMRVVNGKRDFLLDRAMVSLARSRVQAIQIEEVGEEMEGTLFVLPTGRRFEFEVMQSDVRITFGGSVSPLAAAQIAGQQDIEGTTIDARHISNKPMRLEIQTRTIQEINRSPRKVYRLLRLIGPADDGPGMVAVSG
ncbi:hypothetical protein [Rugamonas sp.]|uniref:hypothetical protein n=1 Tax=Rugamonas sp. TaxID=1926287 RepID=UPI0025F43779|nr:hypothetical protein [Rugamonas sp.]